MVFAASSCVVIDNLNSGSAVDKASGIVIAAYPVQAHPAADHINGIPDLTDLFRKISAPEAAVFR